jgi:hypothetical protein
MLKTLVFAPHSDIWLHAFPEALVAESLKKSGQQLVYVGCGRVFEAYCVCMSTRGLKEASDKERKAAVCRSCVRNERLVRSQFGFEGYALSEVLTEEDYRQAAERVAQASPATLLGIEEDGIPVGRYALYEYLLGTKKSNAIFSDAEWQQCAIHLRNAFLALFGGKRILDREKPSRVIVYNSLYSVNHIVCALAEASGALTYFLHTGLNLSDRLQHLIMGRHSTISYFGALIERWPQWKDVACDRKTMRHITDHFLVLFRGTSVFGYSSRSSRSSDDVRQRYGIASGQRIVVAAMSSYDELFAAETVGVRDSSLPLLFPRQLDWIRSLLDFIAKRKDLFLLIRVHPREFPNKREGVKSEHAALLQKMLADLPANARVNWPADQVSLYDLANETSVFLTAWSSVGKEMTALGLPVVSYCPRLLLYPAALHEAATTLPEYHAAIERALASGWSFERVRRAYRWLALEYRHGAFSVADGFRRPENGLVERAWRRIARAVHPSVESRLETLQQWLDCVRRPRRLAESDAIEQLVKSAGRTPLDFKRAESGIDPSEEERHLRRELTRLRRALFGARRCESPDTLCANLDRAVNRGP